MHDPTWTKTNVIMTDIKDMMERDVLQEAFPNATLQLLSISCAKMFFCKNSY